MKTLVAYFSRKGYVQKIAEKTAEENSADLLRLETSERTEGFLGFMWCGRINMHRWEMPLKNYDIDVSQYDRVIVCSPIWVFTVCAPVRAFLKENNGRFKSVDYILLHFSFPMKYTKTLQIMDSLSGVQHQKFTSIACQLGKTMLKKEY